MRRIPAGAILSIALAAASCGGESSTEPDDDTPTGEEALALLEVAIGQGFVLAGDVTSGSEIMTPDGVVLQFMAPCAMGGTMSTDDFSFVGVSLGMKHSFLATARPDCGVCAATGARAASSSSSSGSSRLGAAEAFLRASQRGLSGAPAEPPSKKRPRCWPPWA